jgi:2-desacetyl-2-hydroxyethyl bacteriochlorophyllide A dehydrogenase
LENLRCVIPSTGEVDLVTLPAEPLPESGLRLRTDYSLVSPGTEGAMYSGTHIGFPDPENLYAKYPFHPGYAAVGTVIEVGSAAPGFAHGDRVYWYGRHERIGVVDARKSVVVKPPVGLDSTHVPFVRLAQVSYTALAATEGMKAGVVAVVGLGMIGNFAAQLYRAAGAKVYAFDTVEERCRLARACGIEHAVRVEGDLVEAVRGACGNEAIDVVVEATGIGMLVEPCLRCVGYHGTVVLLGSPREKATIDIYKFIHRPATRLVGAHVNLVPVVSDTRKDQRRVTADILAAMADGGFIVAPLLSAIVTPDRLKEAYEALESCKSEKIGVLLDWRDF